MVEELRFLVPVTVEWVVAPRSLARKVTRYFWTAQAATAALVTWWQPAVGAVIHGLLLVAVTVAGLRSARVVIGEDGVHLCWWNAERFISYAEVAGVTKDERGATLRLVSGEAIQLWAQFYGGHLREILTAQITDRMERWAGWPAVFPRLLPSGPDTYRETAWALAERVDAAINPRTPPDVRVRVATTLLPEAEDLALARVTESAGATANPEVRNSLLAVVESSTRSRGR